MVKLMRRLSFILVILLAGLNGIQAQDLPTPAPVFLSSPTPLPVFEETSPTPVNTSTPETAGPAILEALVDAGDVNVRAEADPDAAIIGSIRNGTQYAVTGRYFRWYQIRYEDDLGYVFEDLVSVLGDQTLIPDLSLEPIVTADVEVIGLTETWAAITLTPGIELTATANANVLQGPVPAGGAGITVLEHAEGTPNPDEPRAILPTFTYPPQVAQLSTETVLIAASPTPQTTTLDEIANSGVTPIVPIAVLGGFGLLGLVISSFRR